MSKIVDEVIAANKQYVSNFGAKKDLALPPARVRAAPDCAIGNGRVEEHIVVGDKALEFDQQVLTRQAGADEVAQDAFQKQALGGRVPIIILLVS